MDDSSLNEKIFVNSYGAETLYVASNTEEGYTQALYCTGKAKGKAITLWVNSPEEAARWIFVSKSKKTASDSSYHIVVGAVTLGVNRFIESLHIFSSSQNSRIWMQLRSGCFTASPSGAIFRAGANLVPSHYDSVNRLLFDQKKKVIKQFRRSFLPILDNQTSRSTSSSLTVLQIRRALFNVGISSFTESGQKLNKPALSARLYDVLHNPAHQQPKCLPSEMIPADGQRMTEALP